MRFSIWKLKRAFETLQEEKMRIAKLKSVLVFLGALLLVLPLCAQETEKVQPPSTSKVEQLEKKISDLSNELKEMKAELDELKKDTQESKQKAQLAALKSEAAAAAASPAKTEKVDTTTKFQSGTRMQPQLNPEISVAGNMFLLGGDREKERASSGEWELDVQSYLDPYTKAHVVFSKPEDDNLDVEEGYITWLNLPGNTQLTFGKKRQQFGVINRWHSHALDQVDLPWVLQESFGKDGLIGTGLSFDWVMPKLWADTNELTLELTNGDNDTAFAGPHWKHPTELARFKNYWDLTKNAYLEIGLDALRGKADPDGHLDHDFYATDLTYDWYPAGRGLYREFIVRGMLLRSDLDLDEQTQRLAWGGYLYGQFKFSRRFIAGLRYDRVDDQRMAGHYYWGYSPYVTFWQSEFVRLRAQMSYRRDNLLGVEHRYMFQVVLAAGPHKHDKY